MRLIDALPEIAPYFIEIGAGDGTENNTRILLDHGWEGAWFDPLLVGYESHNDKLGVCPWKVTRDNVPRPMRDVGLLSIDVDGNDYWLWSAYGPGPSIVIIEAQIQKPEDEPWIMPYDPEYVWNHRDNECGASVFSMVELGKELGYTLVTRPTNPHSPNLFFVKNELVSKL